MKHRFFGPMHSAAVAALLLAATTGDAIEAPKQQPEAQAPAQAPPPQVEFQPTDSQ